MTPENKSTKSTGRKRYSIRVLERAIRLLSTLSDGDTRSLAEIADEIELSTSTTFRLLYTLEQHRYVQRDGHSNTFRLGPACLGLARAYLEGIDVRQAAMPILEALRDHTHETVHLAILDQMEVFYLEKIPGFHAIGLMASRVGTHVPAYCTALGKALLAFSPEAEVRAYYARHGLKPITPTTITDLDTLMAQLEQVRQQGYAVDRSEREPEVYCGAAPIRGIDGEVMAAVSVSGPAYRMERAISAGNLAQVVREAARSISFRIADRGGRIVPPPAFLAAAQSQTDPSYPDENH